MNIFLNSRLITRLTLMVAGVLVVGSCTSESGGEHQYFEDLTNQEEVVIGLKSFGLDSVPADIGFLTSVRELAISYDSIAIGQWVVLPPLSALDEMVDRPPFYNLPNEITQLPHLTKLSIIGLNIRQLPEGFDELKQLEYLDLSMNKLTITNELNKLSGLPRLKRLLVLGNRIDTTALQNWNKEHPSVKIIY